MLTNFMLVLFKPDFGRKKGPMRNDSDAENYSFSVLLAFGPIQPLIDGKGEMRMSLIPGGSLFIDVSAWETWFEANLRQVKHRDIHRNHKYAILYLLGSFDAAAIGSSAICWLGRHVR